MINCVIIMLVLVFLTMPLPLHVAAPETQYPLPENFQDHPVFRNASVGYHLIDLESGKTISGHNEEKLFIPASVMKLITAAAATELLGPEYLYQTKTGYRGEINNDALKGDLIVKGGGDPALGSEYFDGHYGSSDFLKIWARHFKACNIKRVTGDLVIDISLYDSEKVPPKWIWEDIGNYYGAGASALTAFDNLFRITFRSPKNEGEITEIISVYPDIQGIEIENKVLSSNLNKDMAYVFGSPFDTKRIITGTIPKNRNSFTIKASNPFPEKLLAERFADILAAEGIFLSGDIRIVTDEVKDVNVLYIQYSPPLKEIVKVMNSESVNLFAEHLVKQIAVLDDGAGSRVKGTELVREFWEQKGLDNNQLIMEDGSGLSHFNAAAPSFITSVLNYMENSEYHDQFISTLPRAGEGTVTAFSNSVFPGETLRIKSGSMTGVRCYGGYLTTDRGSRLAFAIMINHFSGSGAGLTGKIEKLISSWKTHY
jgi:serine-type D-Ala-D-Ala carboxypeptidase/endopeptidase (penicillin-binding protein 4)